MQRIAGHDFVGALAHIAAHPQAQQPWDAKDYKIPGGAPSNPKIAGALVVAPAMLGKTTRGRYPAPEAALSAMVEGAMVDYDTALRIESRYLARLMTTPVAHNMINTFFFDMNAIKAGKSRPAGVARFKPTKVGILGVKVWICHGTVYGKRDLFEIAGASASQHGGQQAPQGRGPRGGAPRNKRRNNNNK